MTSTLYTGDNLYILNGLNSNSVDLIYLDPPFNSKRMYAAPIGSKAAGASFKDMWAWDDVNEAYLENLVQHYPGLVNFIESIGNGHGRAMMAYITYMTQRVIELHRILKDNGSIYLHCDPTASHYLKIMLDSIFGKENFRNEIVWCYGGRGMASKWWNKKHDIILFYTKTDTHRFNTAAAKRPLNAKYTGRYNKVDDDGKKYALIKNKDGSYSKIFMKSDGVVREDYWEIPFVRGKEYTGYPTQKPLTLLRRIIEVSSNKGDVVLDPFCGCATACVAAQQLGREWIGIDIAEQCAQILVDRLTGDAGLFSDFVSTANVPERTDIQPEKQTASVKQRLFEAQTELCNGCYASFEARNLEVDHIIPKSKGGGNYYTNYQLLCSNCNRTKGNRPMEYLRAKIENRNKIMKKVVFGN